MIVADLADLADPADPDDPADLLIRLVFDIGGGSAVQIYV